MAFMQILPGVNSGLFTGSTASRTEQTNLIKPGSFWFDETENEWYIKGMDGSWHSCG